MIRATVDGKGDAEVLVLGFVGGDYHAWAVCADPHGGRPWIEPLEDVRLEDLEASLEELDPAPVFGPLELVTPERG